MTAPASRVVRVFISSTFRDFGAERDLLMKRVFPELRRRARARFVEVIGVDLRWGITEEESEKGETLPICLREIERSRPYFVCLLGERYGWTPAAGQYPELLLEQQPWLREHAGGKSVTELEILHGVLNAPEMAGRAYFYFRDPAFSEGKGADYASEDEDARGKLARLQERIRGSAFPVAGFATPEEVADRITDDLWRLIDAEYPEDAVPDELERERRSHEAYAAERRRLYIGQEETVAALLARLEAASDEPGEEGSRTRTTLVTAESGTGKSALIANTLARYREAHPDHVVIEHYIGSTSEASDPMKVIRRVSEEIRRLTGASREVEDDPEKLVEQFAEWLAEASWWAGRRGVRLVLALDAIDKLTERSDLRWLPKVTAPHVRIVVSSLDGDAVEAMRKRQPGEVQARPFTPEVARNYIVETLARRGRRLPTREVDRIVSHPRATLPIYLKTLVEELSVFGSHEGLSQRITECLAAQEPDDLFEVILARLEEDLGRDAVKKPLEAIWASSEGMSEDELVGFTGVSPLDLARLRLSLDDMLYETSGLLRLAHAYAAKGVADRYLADQLSRERVHSTLADWWLSVEASRRSRTCALTQLIAAGSQVRLRAALEHPDIGCEVLLLVDEDLQIRSWTRAFASHSDLMRSAIDEAFGRHLDLLRGRADPARITQALIRMAHILLRCGAVGGKAGLAVWAELEGSPAASLLQHGARHALSIQRGAIALPAFEAWLHDAEHELAKLGAFIDGLDLEALMVYLRALRAELQVRSVGVISPALLTTEWPAVRRLLGEQATPLHIKAAVWFASSLVQAELLGFRIGEAARIADDLEAHVEQIAPWGRYPLVDLPRIKVQVSIAESELTEGRIDACRKRLGLILPPIRRILESQFHFAIFSMRCKVELLWACCDLLAPSQESVAGPKVQAVLESISAVDHRLRTPQESIELSNCLLLVALRLRTAGCSEEALSTLRHADEVVTALADRWDVQGVQLQRCRIITESAGVLTDLGRQKEVQEQIEAGLQVVGRLDLEDPRNLLPVAQLLYLASGSTDLNPKGLDVARTLEALDERYAPGTPLLEDATHSRLRGAALYYISLGRKRIAWANEDFDGLAFHWTRALKAMRAVFVHLGLASDRAVLFSGLRESTADIASVGPLPQFEPLARLIAESCVYLLANDCVDEAWRMRIVEIGVHSSVLGIYVVGATEYRSTLTFLRDHSLSAPWLLKESGHLRVFVLTWSWLGEASAAEGDCASALCAFATSLQVQRRLLAASNEVPSQWKEEFAWSLSRFRDMAIACGELGHAYSLALERWQIAIDESKGDQSPRELESLLSHAAPLLECVVRCEADCLVVVAEAPVRDSVDRLLAAFDDPAVDRVEHALDSTTLFLCAKILELMAHRAERMGTEQVCELRTHAQSVLAAAEALKLQEDA